MTRQEMADQDAEISSVETNEPVSSANATQSPSPPQAILRDCPVAPLTNLTLMCAIGPVYYGLPRPKSNKKFERSS